MTDWGWQMGGFGMLLWVVILVVIIWLVVRLTQQNRVNGGSGQHHHLPAHEESALDVLKKRYARGEITRDEFQEMKDDLTDR